VQVQHDKVQVAEAAPPSGETPRSDASPAEAAVVAPVPPPRPAELAPPPEQSARGEAAPATPQPATAEPSEPPFRPLAPGAAPSAKVSHWGAPISGAAPVLATARFAPFPYRLIRKG
jgi:hypothetical protein